MAKPLDELNELLDNKFDSQAFRIMLGSVKSHYLDLPDPVWLLLVGPGSTGKSAMLDLITGLDQVEKLGVFNDKTFLNGSGQGLLQGLGSTEREGDVYTTQSNGLFLLDNLDDPFPKPKIVGQLRKIHEGEFRESYKTSERIWRGKVTFIAASRPTPLPDALRKEFLQVKIQRSTDPRRLVGFMEQIDRDKKVRTDLRRVIKKLFDAPPSSPVPTLSEEQEQRIRDSFPDTAPQLASLAKGIADLQGQDKVEEQDLQDALRAGQDTKGDEE